MRKKKKRIFGRKISNELWLSFKPYNAMTKYDQYYIEKAVGAYTILRVYRDWFESFEIPKEHQARLACVLTCHFEDFMNEIGIWEFFQQTNQKLYNYPLPFYSLEGYDLDYLNPADFSYLIWHYMSQLTGRLFGPDAPPILAMGHELYDFFEALIDEAPVTNTYDLMFKIEDQTPFYEVKERLKWFAFGSYTLGVEFTDDFNIKLSDFLADEDGIKRIMPLDKYAYTIQDDYLYTRKSSFSAISVPEWFAGIANCSAILKQAILGVNKRLLTQFAFEEETQKHWVLRQPQTDELFEVVKESVNLTKETSVKGSMHLMPLVQWKGEWWLSGTSTSFGQLSETEEERMKKDIASIPFRAYSEENQLKLRATTDDMYHDFIEYFGSPVVLFNSQKELQQAMQDQQEFYNNKRVVDKVAGDKAKDNYEDKYKERTDDVWGGVNFDKNKGLGLVFIKGVGSLIDPDIVKIIPLMKAPSIDRKGTQFLFECLVGPDTHEQITGYLLANYPTHNFKFPIAISKVNIMREAKFFMRFLNPDGFLEKKPNTRHVPRLLE